MNRPLKWKDIAVRLQTQGAGRGTCVGLCLGGTRVYMSMYTHVCSYIYAEASRQTCSLLEASLFFFFFTLSYSLSLAYISASQVSWLANEQQRSGHLCLCRTGTTGRHCAQKLLLFVSLFRLCVCCFSVLGVCMA